MSIEQYTWNNNIVDNSWGLDLMGKWNHVGV